MPAARVRPGDRPRIDPMTARDVVSVAAIEAAAFGADAWPPEVFRELLRAFARARPARGRLWVARDAASGDVLGYAGVEVSGLRGEMDVINIAVAKEHRREGVGEALLRVVMAHCRRLHVPLLWLRVRASNLAARRFYARVGFRPRGRFAGYYQDPDEPAVIMAMDMEGRHHR
jgi:ribosomal-protein-alanine N-acetyltransferase